MKAGVNDEKKIGKNGMQIMFMFRIELLYCKSLQKYRRQKKIISYYYIFFLQFPLLRIIVQVNEIPNIKIRSFVYLITFAVYVQKR